MSNAVHATASAATASTNQNTHGGGHDLRVDVALTALPNSTVSAPSTPASPSNQLSRQQSTQPSPQRQTTTSTTSLSAQGSEQGRGNRRSAETRVRRNFFTAFSRISRASKIIVISHAAIFLAQIAVAITFLALSTDEECEEPLRFYMAAHMLRLALTLPFLLHSYVYPSERQRDQNQPHADQRTFAERAVQVMDTVGVMLFVLGNFWLFSAGSCQSTAPKMYFTSLSFIILGYAAIALPVLLVLGIIFCLPFVLLVLRIFQQTTGMPLVPVLGPQVRTQRAREEVIQSIPKERYVVDGGSIAIEDASCVICLSTYAGGDELKRLPGCRHHFHAQCLDEWLHINRTCPLCVRNVEEEMDKTVTE